MTDKKFSMTSETKISVLIAERDERISVLESAIASLCEAIEGRDPAKIERMRSAAMEAYGRNPSRFSVQPERVVIGGGPSTDEGRYSEMMRSRAGVANLHRLLSKAKDREAIVDEILGECDVCAIARASSGRHALPTICTFASQAQRRRIIASLARDVVSVARDYRGGITMQAMCGATDGESNLALCSAVAERVGDLWSDQAGSYVVRAVVRRHAGSPSSLPPQSGIYDFVSGRLCEMSRAQFGCAVVDECIDCSDDAWRSSVVAAITPHVGELAMDRYGNYVVQHVIGSHPCGGGFVAALAAAAPDLCFSKYGSNAIEAALRCPAAFPAIVAAVVDDRSFYRMIDDRYGNFVVQKIATLCDLATRYAIEKKIAAHVRRRGETHYAAYVKLNLAIKC